MNENIVTTKPGRTQRNIGQTILSDLGRDDLHQSLSRDLRDLYYFYLDEEERDRVAKMGRVKRWICATFWIMKGLVLKLKPARRLLLVLAVILSLQLSHPNYARGGVVILLLILILELKDKLLAQDELAAGRAIQLALMPDRSPKIPGWDIWLFTRPANDVGGDLVDYLRIQEDRMGLALGDVAGKGLGAALLMSKLQSTLRALAPGFDSVSELGSQMNRIFYRDAIRSSFASLMYLEISPDFGDIRVLNAGHLPAIAVHDGFLSTMARGGPALGVLPGSVYNEQVARLDSGDMFVVYSDGVTEACDTQTAFFGVQRLMDLLPELQNMTAEQAGERLLSDVDTFVGEAKPHDDISLLILKRL